MELDVLSPEAASEQYQLFLLDGLRRSPSPLVLVVREAATAALVALRLHDGGTSWDERPARIDGLLQLDLASLVAGGADRATSLLTELATTDHWAFLPNVDTLVESEVGRGFLDGLIVSVGQGEIAAVIASTTPERLPHLQKMAPRLMGFAITLPVGEGKATYRSIAARSTNSLDTGWVVAVRYELTGDIQREMDAAGPAADGRLHLVDSMSLVKRETGPPLGLLVDLSADAFTASQGDAAFATAALAATRLVGRPLRPGEQVTAARGIFYA
ncbi:hypothetical protein [Streptomyces sp. NRRL F-2580]|uniref:hypothetical protein n=1 Tax=Streptomyces sp. NRRL F-2580 TaxID=1463841 RepID=UPI0004C8528B|nr:hypothetical protein [Streptomyces sp. NRRL F-2580]